MKTTTTRLIILMMTLFTSTVVSYAQNKDYNRVDFVYNHNFTSHHKEWVIDTHPKADLDGVALQYIHGFHLSKSLPLYLEVGGRIAYHWDHIKLNDVGGQYGLSEPYVLNLKLNPYLWNIYVPVNFGYRFNVCEKFKIMPYVGLFGRYNFVGKNTTHYTVTDGANIIVDEERKKDLFKDDNGLKHFQCGLNLGANFEYEHVVLGASWGVGFIKNQEHYTIYDLNITLGYRF